MKTHWQIEFFGVVLTVIGKVIPSNTITKTPRTVNFFSVNIGDIDIMPILEAGQINKIETLILNGYEE